MAAVTQRAIHSEFAWLRSKDLHDLANHDRPMRARGSLAGGDHLGDVFGITLRRMLFVLLRKMSRILSSVPQPAFGLFRTHFIHSVLVARIYGTGFSNVLPPRRDVRG